MTWRFDREQRSLVAFIEFQTRRIPTGNVHVEWSGGPDGVLAGTHGLRRGRNSFDAVFLMSVQEFERPVNSLAVRAAKQSGIYVGI